jgi:RNA polymerase sigma-70 factor (ECF subfamily)
MPTPDWPLERYRPLVSLHVRQLRLGRLYRARFDSSDVVQESFVRAVKGFDGVRGTTEPELVRWLQAIVGNVLVDLVREHGAGKRDPRLERTAGEAGTDADTPLAAYGSASGPGPATDAERREELLRLADAVAGLPEAEQDAVVGHYLLELPLAEVAERMGRTEKGVAGLLYRGTGRLRERLTRREGGA